jgi:transcriptional regulator GlxA family with amidase domain
VRWVANEIDENPSLLNSAAAMHLETGLESLCLRCLLGASGCQRLDCQPIGKLELADLELWIYAHLDQPISIEFLAEKCDCSIRSVQLAFRKHRDCTPMQFVRQARLWAVRRKLREGAEQGVMISEIAFDCGFPHLGRFAQHYRETFGEAPSETVAKSAKS